ncbi:OmpA family protein [Psychromonas sp. GE-S-Ul-11]|jgi:outer membrane protein OmpA-like peptidoglycan-associated protein|uniref:OmpA family protein n=1 Tax=Psychromonas sp. GE-S-Ul-11 TaxID=3241170 RepID=UPI00390CC032
MKENNKPLIYLFLCLFLLVGCTSDQHYLVGPTKDVEASTNSDELDKVQVLFYFESDDSDKKQSVLVHSETRLLGALLDKLYFYSAFCVGEEVLRFEKREKGFHAQDTITNTHYGSFKIEKDQPLYLGVVVNQDGTIATNITTKKDAEKVVGKIVNRTFLVNRKVEACHPPIVEATPPKQDVKLKNIELSADALFAFDSATLNKQLVKKNMSHILEQVNRSDISVTRIVVSGHSDRLGEAGYNQRLSEERAQAVVNYLISEEVRAPIESIGYGSRQPITDSECSSQLSQKSLIDCLQPDRRVSVELWGNYQDESTLSATK